MDLRETRLYYQDAYLTHFDAQVLEQFPVEKNWGVVLDHSAFYPTSGGQPHDTGTLNGVPVINVFEREADKAVVHVLSCPLDEEQVHGQVNWERRFDFMQQHTGQHILSHACEALLDADTVGFHLTESMLTIDITHAPLTLDEWQAIQEAANAIVFANEPVESQFMSEAEVNTLPLRKRPTVAGPIRIVRTAGRDYSPCGGTHCRTTGSVGLILIRKAERRGPETRLDFVCGRRALADAHRKNHLVNELAASLSVGEVEVTAAVARLQEEAKSVARQLKQAENRLLDFEVEQLLRQAETIGDIRVVRITLSRDNPTWAKYLAVRLAERPKCVALIGFVQDDSVQLTFSRSGDTPVDMRPLLKEACRIVGGGGGGQPNMAQGGGSRPDQLEHALEGAVQSLKKLLLSQP